MTPCNDEAAIYNPDFITHRLRRMATVVITVLLAGSLALAGCTAPGAQAGNSRAETQGDREERQQEALDNALDEYLRANPGLIASVSVGDHQGTIGYGEKNRFETASVVKVEILVRWLSLRQNAALPQDELELAREMIISSDNDSTSELCEIITGSGRPDAIPGGTNVCVTSPDWGTDETTAKSQRQILEAAFDSTLLNERSKVTLNDLMGSVDQEQSWGVSAASTTGERYWTKNGWDVRDNGWVAHSNGVIETPSDKKLYMAVMTDGSGSEAEGIDHVEQIAQLARDAHNTH